MKTTVSIDNSISEKKNKNHLFINETTEQSIEKLDEETSFIKTDEID